MTIKILSNTTINRIAAGEVVERPASVIKELVENSIDAGAKKIDIFVENAGSNMITIIDDGVGMSKEDLVLAVERHATSKLSDEDINNICFFGFRGEALPSIASVSRMTISSKLSDCDMGWSLSIIGGEKQDLSPAAITRGTKIEVRDLFFATPARLKFLKTEKTELHYITDTLTKIAMANPNIAFSLTSNNKILLNLVAYKDNDAIFDRLNDLVGKGFKENFTYIALQEQDCKIYGYISLPTYNTGTSTEQYFFINKRPIRDKLLSVAVKIAYQDFIPSGRYPMVYLFLELDSAFVDVNVHPAKAEVRFKDTNLIRKVIIAAIKHGIKSIGNKAADHLSAVAIDSFVIQETPTSIVAERPRSTFSYAARPTMTKPLFAAMAPLVEAEPKEFDQQQISYPMGSACGQVHNTYILSQTEDGMILVDQHAAHERIFYERLKQQILSDNVPTQRLLIPEIIELAEHIIESLLSNKEELQKFGLHLEAFGSGAISVTELPSILACSNVKDLILNLIDDIKEYSQSVSLEQKINHFLATFACHHSIRAGKSLSIREMNDLLRQMESSLHTGQCNHGRPTYIKLTLKDIEKLFERI